MKSIVRMVMLSALASVCLMGCGGGDRPSALVGRWVHYEGTTRDKPEDIELFKDGTGVLDKGSVTWKVENKRLVFLSALQGLSCNYNVQGHELILAYDDEKSATFVKMEHFEEYKKKKEEEKKKEAEEAKRIEELEEQVDTYMEKDMYDKAIELSNEIIKIAPKSARGYVCRGNAYHNSEKDYGRAIADYTMALKLDTEGPDSFFKRHHLYYLRGNSYEEKGDYDKALADYNNAIQLDPNDEDYYNGRGYAYLKKGDYDKALADFNKAVQLAPNEVNPYDSRGEAYLTMGDYDNAIADYSKALQLDPNFESAKEGLAKAKQKKQER
jgi:tetratricopeptide (TPR) repeat protein